MAYAIYAGALYLLYKAFMPTIARWWRGSPFNSTSRGGGPGGHGGGGGGGSGSNAPGFGGGPPPPYTKAHAPPNPTQRTEPTPEGQAGWRPGFFSGAAAAYAGTQLFNRLTTDNRGAGRARDREYDWDQRRGTMNYGMRDRGSLFGGGDCDRGVGGSGTRWGGGGGSSGGGSGSMRESTGFGGTRNR